MHKPTPYKFRLFYFLFFVAVFIVGIPILVFYSAGYSIDDTFGLSIRGGIYVYTPEPGTSVFMGNELKNTSGFFNKEVLVGGLKPDQYLVLATNEQYWPWAKIVHVNRGEVEALFPFLVPKVVEAEEIKSTDSDYEDILELFTETRDLLASVSKQLPAPERAPERTPERAPNSRLGGSARGATSTLVSTTTPQGFDTISRRQTEVWLDNNTILGRWLGRGDAAPNYYCRTADEQKDSQSLSERLTKNKDICTEPILIFKSSVPIRAFDFYPYRDDAIILALDNGIYAVENDFRSYQNFYPLYRGVNPDFRVYKNQVYIKDGAYIATLDLDI